MKITCPTCNATYSIPNRKIPDGKKASATCKKCGNKIVVESKSDKVVHNNFRLEYQKESVKDISSAHLKYSSIKNNNPAGFWIRFLAHIIDSAIIYFPLSNIFYFIQSFAGFTSASQAIYQLIFGILVSAIYYTALTGKYGLTCGKKVFDLKVVNSDGTKISYIKSFLRWCSYLVSYLTIGIGFCLAGWTKEKKALHDYVVGTKVVRLKSKKDIQPKSKKRTALIISAIILVILGVIGTTGYLGIKFFLNNMNASNIFLEDIRTGDIVTITEDGVNSNPKFSPNGKRILYAHRLDDEGKGGTTIKVYSLLNKATMDILHDGNFNIPHSWGPEGEKILFSARINGQTDLWFYSIADNNKYQITNDEALEEDAVLSPDGKWILFCQNVEEKKEVFLISSKGGEKKRITYTDSLLKYPKAVTWSRDSREILYFSFISIVIQNIYTGEEERVDLLGKITNQSDLLCHPTQKDLIIFKARNGQSGLKSNLFLYSRKTTVLQVWKTKRPLLEMFYDISPDGEKITYVRFGGFYK